MQVVPESTGLECQSKKYGFLCGYNKIFENCNSQSNDDTNINICWLS